jgi:glycosyltransferase involved in cell wall biosynthesis
MNNMVPVSVVIPCYRCSKTIERCVASVAAQSMLPLELLLVDDGSADETRAVLSDLLSRYPSGWIRLVLLDQNVGAASARNIGWDAALGDFVAFLDSDDSWHPRKIELQYPYMKLRPDIVVSGHGHLQVDVAPIPLSLGISVFQQIPALYVLLKNPFITPSFMVRRDLQFRFLAGRRYMEDHYFLMQVSAAGLGIAKTREPLAFIYKNIFGDAGLSADLWAMQRSELENYGLLYHVGHISSITAVFLKGYSWLKFSRRILVVVFRKRLYSFKKAE